MNAHTSVGSLSSRLVLAAVIGATSFFLPAAAVQAQELVYQDARPYRFFLGGGLTAGGDRLVTARYINGSDESLRGGGTIQIHGGMQFQVAPSLTMALSLGYHIDAIDTFWGSTWFARVPVEALAHYQLDRNWRIGGGIRYAIDPTLSSDGYAPDVDEHFRSSVSPVVEIEYLFTPHMGLKLRAVNERYKSKVGLPTVDGDHVGLIFNYYF
jgi:hypothetical protein